MATADPQFDSTVLGATRFVPRDGSGEVLIPADAHQLDGFRSWARSASYPERGEVSFVKGEVVIDLSPENFEVHNCLKSAVSSAVFFLVQQRNLGMFFSDRFLFVNESAGVSTEPDAMFLSRNAYRAGRAKFTQSEIQPGTHVELTGSPDWVLEVVSHSSKRKDTQLLRKGYFDAGIPEYWLVDGLGEQVSFQLLVAGRDGYIPVEPLNGWCESPTFGRAFRITRETDEDGFWQYTLHIEEIP